jgi:hypothetical protein
MSLRQRSKDAPTNRAMILLSQLHDRAHATASALSVLASRIGVIVFVGTAAAAAPTLNAQVTTLTLVPELRIDGEKEDFSTISSVRANSRGDIAVTLTQDAQIRVYDANGRRVSTFGRRGSGPGEFQFFFDAKGWIGDTVWIVDGNLKRLTYITRAGKLIRTESTTESRWTRTGSNGTVASFTPNARSRDGGWLGAGAFYQGETKYLRAFMALTPTDARFIATIDADSTYEFWPFAAGAVTAFSQDGEHAAYASANALLLNGGKYRVRLFRRNGDTVYTREFDYTGVPLSRRTVDSVLARGVGPNRLRALPGNQIPPVHRPLEALHFGADGRLWITIRESHTTLSAIVLDQRGVVVARAPLPPRTQIMAADRTRIWLKVEDEAGTESLVRYRLIERSR